MRRIPPYLLVAFCGLMMFVLGVVTIFAAVGFQPTDQIQPTLMAMLTQMPEPAVATQLAQMGNVISPDVQATAQTMYEQGAPLDGIANMLAVALSDTSGASATAIPADVQNPVVATAITPDSAVQPTTVEAVLQPTTVEDTAQSTAIEVIVQPTTDSAAPLPTAVVDAAQPTTDSPAPLPTAIVDAAQPTSDGVTLLPTTVEDAAQPTADGLVPLPTAIVEVAQPTADSPTALPTAIVDTAQTTAEGGNQQSSRGEVATPVPTTDTSVILPTNVGDVSEPTLIQDTPQPTADTSVAVATAVETAVPAQDVVVATVPGDVGNISGSIVFSDKASGDGISLLLTRPDGTTLNLPVAGDGNFAFAGMLPGAYTLEAAAPGYLSARAEFTLDAGQNLTLTTGSLLVGDTNGDGVIDLLDAALIASNFGGSVIVPQADLNHDGVVDVRDLTMIGSEFGLAGPISWK